MLGGVYVYYNAEKYLHPLLIPPDYYWQTNSEDIYSKTGILEIAEREFEIPVAYVNGRFINGQKEGTIFMSYILPDFKSKLEMENKDELYKKQLDGFTGAMLLEESAIRPSFKTMIENRKRNLKKSEVAGIVNGLKHEKWFRGTEEEPILYYDIFIELNNKNKIVSFIECTPETKAASPRCSHRFRNNSLLYQVSYSRSRYFPDWKNQRLKAIEFLESMEIK